MVKCVQFVEFHFLATRKPTGEVEYSYLQIRPRPKKRGRYVGVTYDELVEYQQCGWYFRPDCLSARLRGAIAGYHLPAWVCFRGQLGYESEEDGDLVAVIWPDGLLGFSQDPDGLYYKRLVSDARFKLCRKMKRRYWRALKKSWEPISFRWLVDTDS